LGSTYTGAKDKPVGVCCKDSDTCDTYLNDPSYKCSDLFTEELFSYQMCPVPVDKCGPVDADLVYNHFVTSREIRGLNQGETCNYRLKAECGAPAFKAAPGGTFSSSLSHFNITWVESEDDTTTQCVDTPGWTNGVGPAP
jgi:hypothetical protein